MRKKGQKVIDTAVNAAFTLGSKIDNNLGKYMMKSCLKSFQKSSDSYVSFISRPKTTEKIACLPLESTMKKKIAIVLQGPIFEKDNFTLETIKLYKRIMPEAIIVLSTWESTGEHIIQAFRKLDIEIVLSSHPQFTGIGNINYQVYSTRQGIKRAKESGADYVMKTRTDQRFSQTNLLEYMDALIRTFPIHDAQYAQYQNQRIIALQGSVGGNMFIPYFVPDFFFFGNIDDIWNFFNIPLQNINQSREERSCIIEELRKNSVWEYYYNTAPEIQITLDYLKRIGISDLGITCEKWWDIVKNLFIFVSYDDVRFFWPKYDNHFDENFINMNYSDNDITQRKTYVWNFHNWLLVETEAIVYSSFCDHYINERADVI